MCIWDYHKGKYILLSDMTHKTTVIVYVSLMYSIMYKKNKHCEVLVSCSAWVAVISSHTLS